MIGAGVTQLDRIEEKLDLIIKGFEELKDELGPVDWDGDI